MQGQFSLMTLVPNSTNNVFEEHLINSIEESEDERIYLGFDELRSPLYLTLLGFILLAK